MGYKLWATLAQYWDVAFVFRGRAAPEFLLKDGQTGRQADGRTDPFSDPYGCNISNMHRWAKES